MKKAIFLLLAVGLVSFGVYSCQKDSVDQITKTTPTSATATERVNYTDCDDCAENCNDCCLKLTCNSGVVGFYFTDAATGNVTTRALTSPGSIYVCAAGGWMGINGASSSGSITVCSTGETMTKPVGPISLQKQLTWDCDILQ